MTSYDQSLPTNKTIISQKSSEFGASACTSTSTRRLSGDWSIAWGQGSATEKQTRQRQLSQAYLHLPESPLQQHPTACNNYQNILEHIYCLESTGCMQWFDRKSKGSWNILEHLAT